MTEIVLATPTPGSIEVLSPQRADQNPVAVYLGSLASSSQATVRRYLRMVMVALAPEGDPVDPMLFPWWELRYQHVERIQRVLRDTHAPKTVNTAMAMVKQILLRCRKLRLMAPDVYNDAVDVKPVKDWGTVKGRMIERHEIVRMLDACDASTPIDVRDKFLLLLLAQGGVRRAEAANVQMEHVDRARRTVLVLKGKGNKPRTIEAHAEMLRAYDAWITLRGQSPGPVLCPVYKGGKIRPERQLSVEAIYFVVDKVADRAKLDDDIAPHDFRRTFISMLLDDGVDIKTVSDMVGHDDVSTTAGYDRRGKRAMRKAIDAFPSFESDVGDDEQS